MRTTRKRAEEMAAFLEGGGETKLARWWRAAHTDAGEYLLACASANGRISEAASQTETILTLLERQGAWETSYEWRIGTGGTDRLEKLDANGFRATATHHGEFSFEAERYGDAVEALQVLSSIQKDLFYAVGWSSWAGPGRLHPEDPARDRAWDSEHRYLERIAKAAISESPKALADVERARVEGRNWEDHIELDGRVIRRRFTSAVADWAHGPVVEVSVTSGTLVTRCKAPTAERALEFGGIFARLHRDIPAVLGWA
jgi:hypothetical protein